MNGSGAAAARSADEPRRDNSRIINAILPVLRIGIRNATLMDDMVRMQRFIMSSSTSSLSRRTTVPEAPKGGTRTTVRCQWRRPGYENPRGG